MSQALDFPPPPANPTPGQQFIGPLGATWTWDGQKWTAGGGPGLTGGGIPDAPSDGTAYGRENGDWVNVLPLAGGTMEGMILLQPGEPTNPLQAVTMQYVDEVASSEELYQGTWQVAANIPDISLGAVLDATNYLAVTANPNVAEMAPTQIPGIGGLLINNGDRIFWAAPLNTWQRIVGDGLDLQIGDSRYLQLAGGTMTGDQYFEVGDGIAFYDVNGYPGFLSVNSPGDVLTWTTTDGGGGQNPLMSIPMYTDDPTLTISPQVQFGAAVWLFQDPVALMQAATKQYVDSHVAAAAGALQFVGTIDGSTGICTFTVASNITPSPGPLPPATQVPNVFVVCDNPGVVPSGPADGMDLSAGDWVVSDGVFWNHIAVGSAGVIGTDVMLNPAILGQTNVQNALQAITQTYLPLSGGTLTGHLWIASPNNLILGGIAAPNNIGPSQIVSPFIMCPWYGFNSYVNNANPAQVTYLGNGYASVIWLDGSGNIEFLIAPSGVAGTPIPGWVNPLLLEPTGQTQVGGGLAIANPLVIAMGPGGYANILYNIAGLRQWSAGCYNDGLFHIADNSGGTDRLVINLDGSINTIGPGFRYQTYGAHTFAFLWDGSFVQIVVDGGSQGQYAPIGFNDGRYLLFTGADTPYSFTFGYVGCTGSTVTLGNASVGGQVSADGNIVAAAGVACGNGATWLTQYGVQYADFGANIFSMRWDGAHCWVGIDNNWAWAQGTDAMLVTTADGRFNRPGFYGGSSIAFGDSDDSTWYLNTYRSDERVKRNITAASVTFDSLAAIAAIPTISYDRTDVPKHVPFGWLGRDIEARIPDGVELKPIWADEPDGYHLDIQALLCHAYRAIGQLNARITTLEARLH